VKANRFITRTLLIRENEWALVNRLFTFEFFQGISIAILFYCSITLFIDHLPTQDLAYSFIISAPFLWLCGALYSKMEHKLETRHLILAVVLVNAAILLLLGIGLMLDEPVWFYYLMLAGFNVAYLLNNLEFWGSAAILFDVRQSKRLFSIISAGDIPAKLVGYLASAFLGKLIGQELLMWLAFLSLIVSLYFYRRLIATGAFDHHQNHDRHEAGHKEEHMNPTAEGALHLVRQNPLIRQAALISFFSYGAFLLLNFLFFGYIKKSAGYHHESLALYIAIFLAGSRAITLFFKLMVTNRLADNLGIRASLLITPILLFMMSLYLLPASMYGSLDAVLYGFATITITIDVLRAAIQSPVLLAAMQPLPVHERLSGHTIIKGITDPFAFFTIGLALSVFFIFSPEVNFRVMSIFLFALLLGYIISILRFGRVYSQTLQSAIRNRTIREREISITDRESIQIMVKKIAGGEPGEAVLALNLGKSLPPETRLEFLRAALKNGSTVVQLKAVMMAKDLNITELLPDLRILASSASDYQLLSATVSAVADLDSHFDTATFLHHPNQEVVAATMAQSLKRYDASRMRSLELLRSWASSGDAHLRERAAEIIGEAQDSGLHPTLFALMEDGNTDVRKKAIASAGRQKNESVSAELLKHVTQAKWQLMIIDSLQTSGDAAVAPVKQLAVACDDEALQKKLILLLGRIGAPSAARALDQLITEIPLMSDALFRAMAHCGFRVDANNKSKYLRLCHDYLNSAIYLTFIIRSLRQSGAHPAVISALESEVLALKERLLQLFAFLFDPASIRKVRSGFELGTKESISNALEIISLTVSRDLARDFIILFETTTYEQKCTLLSEHHPEPTLTVAVIADEIFRDRHHQYHSWTKSALMYFVNKEIPPAVRKSAEVFRHSRDPLLKQTAEWLFGDSTLARG
jgi:hypothetical protein